MDPSNLQAEPPDEFGSRRRMRPFAILLAMLLLMAYASLFIDYDIYTRLGSRPVRPWLLAVLNRLEPFGHGFGAALILISIGVCAPHRWRSVGRVAACAVSAGLAVEVVKLLIFRTRPRELAAGIDSVARRAQALPHWNTELILDTHHQSFPSAHTAVAFALAFGLSQLFPKGRVVFYTCAALVGMQRMVDGRHFASDVLFGAAVGIAVGAGWYFYPRLADPMARWECAGGAPTASPAAE